MTDVFGAESTANEVLEGVDLTGRRVLVTGVSAGLGVETARALVAHGAHVVGAVRDVEKAARAAAAIPLARGDGPGLSFVTLDLASLASVRACAEALIADGRPFDVVIANAGIMADPFGLTADGFERHFGINHLGHFLLVNHIAPLIATGGRLVMLSSLAHRSADVDLDDPNFARTPYEPFLAYSRSKTANILTAVEFDRRHRARGVRATSLHPGAIMTELGRGMTREAYADMTRAARRPDGTPAPGWKSVPQGAATTLWAGFVADADAIGGRYCQDCHVAPITDAAERTGVRAYALDPDRARALWALSEALVGARF